MSIPRIDPSAPTADEIAEHNRKAAAHNMKVAKVNLASNIAEKLAGNPTFVGTTGPEDLARYAVAVAEFILETYSLMPDAAGEKGGLVS